MDILLVAVLVIATLTLLLVMRDCYRRVMYIKCVCLFDAQLATLQQIYTSRYLM